MKFVSRLYLFCAILAEFILVLIDFQGENQIHWSILAGLGLLYVYMILRYAVVGKSGYRVKTIVLILVAVLSLIAVDFFIGYRGWSIDYAITGGLLLVDVIIIGLMIGNRRRWQTYMTTQISMIFLSIVPVVLYLMGVASNIKLAFLPLAVSVFLFVGTLMIGGRKAVQELYRRFYI